MQEIETWIRNLQYKDLSKEVEIISEISISESINQTCKSTLGRELVFVASHAIHHFSLLSAMSSFNGDDSDEEFGIAPATLSYLREQELV